MVITIHLFMKDFNSMKIFIIKLFLYVFPVLLIIFVVSLLIDPFKVFKEYNNYYDQGFVRLNRDMVCTKTYKFYRKTKKFNSFIFGNSRSLAFQLNDWAQYLPENAKPFHFDANGEGLYGVCNKIRYIDELGDTIKNALIVADRDLLSMVKNQNGHLLISSPEISKESRINYYLGFIRAELKLQFLIAYADYSIFKKHRKYMSFLIFESKCPSLYDSVNCNMYFGKERDISNDSLRYYNDLVIKNIFYQRPKKDLNPLVINELEILELIAIRNIFKKHNTNFKIIISPLYDQVPIE